MHTDERQEVIASQPRAHGWVAVTRGVPVAQPPTGRRRVTGRAADLVSAGLRAVRA